MKKVAIYARKSVMSNRGESINIQIETCKNYIKGISDINEEFEFTEYEDEGYSGAHTKRPGLQRMLRDVKQRKIDILVCYKLDRMARSVLHFNETFNILIENKVAFASAKDQIDTGSPQGRFFMQLLVAFAELERETIRERIIDSLNGLAKTGRWLGGVAPVGYKLQQTKIDGTKKKITKLVTDDETVPIVKMLFEKYIELRSLAKLETYLLQQTPHPIKTKRDGYYSNSNLAIILRNPVYVKANAKVVDYFERNGTEFYGDVDGEHGLVSHDKTKTNTSSDGKTSVKNTDMSDWIISVGFHPGIIEADIWLEAQRIMKENRDTFPHSQKSHTALISGILRCKECGSPMNVHARGENPNGVRLQYYVCSMRRASKNVRCNNKNARADMVDQAIRNELKNMGINKDSILAALKEKAEQVNQEIRQTYDPVKLIEADIKKKNKQVDNLVIRLSLTENNDIATEIENRIRAIKQDISKLTDDLNSIEDKKASVTQTQSDIEFVEMTLDRIGQIEKLGLEEQRKLVKALFKRITWDSKTANLGFEFIIDDSGDDDNGGGGGGNDGGNDGGDDYGEGSDINDIINNGISGYSLLESAIMGNNEKSYSHTSSFYFVR